MFLLDTNVISETSKARPHASVLAWASLRADGAFISAITIGEIVKGIQRLPAGIRRARLDQWLSLISAPDLAARILPVDGVVAAEWGRLQGALRRTLPCADSLLAATARVYDLTVATRNERDFADFGVRIVNPWAP